MIGRGRPGRLAAVVAAVLAVSALSIGCSHTRTTLAVHVTAVDGRFLDLNRILPSGTRLELVNASTTHAHELVAVRLHPGERRSAEELVRLPRATLWRVLERGRVTVALAAGPGARDERRSPGLAEGRYLVLDALPVGARSPAAGRAPGRPLPGAALDEAGPLNYERGMYGEVHAVDGADEVVSPG